MYVVYGFFCIPGFDETLPYEATLTMENLKLPEEAVQT